MLVVQPVDATQLAENREMAETTNDAGSEGSIKILVRLILNAGPSGPFIFA